MDILSTYMTHPFWWWVAAGALFLAIEVAVSTEMLLWPAASAAVIAIALLLGAPLGPGVDVAVFAVLTIVSTLLARRFIRRPAAGPDINDPLLRLIGHRGEAVAAFKRGRGRVFVDGKEWAAEMEADAAVAPGDPVEVSAILDGGRLKVRPG
jgi:membrane protein implicated in regulation of membrane protease activity